MSTRQGTPDILGDIMTGTVNVAQETRGALVWVQLGRVYDNPFQPRQSYSDEETRLLADNIWSLRDDLPATLGLQQPPVARVVYFAPDGDETPIAREMYNDPAAVRQRLLGDKHVVQLMFGHRRLRAWRLLRERDNAAYAEFPVFLAFADDRAMWRHAVVENAQRKDIGPLEEAESLRTAITRFGLTQAQAAEPFGFARTTVSNKLRLLELPDDIRQRLAAGKITERHARALLTLAPAPHLWNAVHADREMSVAELEKLIDVLIARCKPMPPAPNTGYKVASEGYYAGNHDYNVRHEKRDPAAWPYDWEPAAKERVGVKILGACSGCTFRVQFGGDAGARCALLDGRCFDVKYAQWEAEQRAAQAEAIRRVSIGPASAGSAAGVGGAAASAGSASAADAEETPDKKRLSGDGEAAAGSVSQETPAPAPALGRIDVAVAADRPIESGVQPQWFTTSGRHLYHAAPAALLKKGLCSAERCACLVVAYNRDAEDHHVRPDAVNAPNMCVGCTSTQRMNNRRKELEVGDLQEHRKRVRAEQEEAERLIREAFEGYRADDLWHNRVIVGAIVQGSMEIEHRYKLKDADMATLQWTLFEGCARAVGRTWDGSTQKWSLEKVQAWLCEVATAAGRVEPEIGMVVDAPAPSTGSGSTLGKFTIPGLRDLVWQCAAETGIPVGGEQTPFWPQINAFVTAAGQNHTIWSVSDLRMAIAQVMRSPGAGDEATHRHWEEDWSDTDEATYQDLILDWDGRAWQSLAAKAIRRVHEGAEGMTPALLLRLAQECPDVTLSGLLGNMARDRREDPPHA